MGSSGMVWLAEHSSKMSAGVWREKGIFIHSTGTKWEVVNGAEMVPPRGCGCWILQEQGFSCSRCTYPQTHCQRLLMELQNSRLKGPQGSSAPTFGLSCPVLWAVFGGILAKPCLLRNAWCR